MATREQSRQLTRDQQITVFKHVALQELNEQDARLSADWQAPADQTDNIENVVNYLEAQGVPQEHIDAALQELEPDKNIYERITAHDGFKAAKEIIKDQIGFYWIAGRLAAQKPELEDPYKDLVEVYRTVGWGVQTLVWGLVAANEPGLIQLPLLTNGVSLSHHPEVLLGWRKSTEDTPEATPKQKVATPQVVSRPRHSLQEAIEDIYLTEARRNLRKQTYMTNITEDLLNRRYLRTQPRMSSLEKKMLHFQESHATRYRTPAYNL